MVVVLTISLGKESAKKLPVLDSHYEWLLIFLSHLGDVEGTDRRRAQGNTFLESHFIVGSISFLHYIRDE